VLFEQSLLLQLVGQPKHTKKYECSHKTKTLERKSKNIMWVWMRKLS